MAAIAENVRDLAGRGARWNGRSGFGVVQGGRALPIGNAGPKATGDGRAPQGVPEMGDPRHDEGYGAHGQGRESNRMDQEGSVPRRAEARHQPSAERSHGYGSSQGYSDTGINRSGGRGPQRAENAQRAEARQQEGQREFHSIHVYGGRAALCFSADETRGEEHTVRVEAAPSKGQRSYDWGDKISLQFTVKELPKVLCVLMGWVQTVEFQAHGAANDKVISMANQEGGKVFINLRQTRTARAVPVAAEDVFGIVDLVIKQMLKNSKHLTADAVLAMARAMSKRYQAG